MIPPNLAEMAYAAAGGDACAALLAALAVVRRLRAAP
jgi:hypothetical protein